MASANGSAVNAAPAGRACIQANYAALPLAFEQNQGQTDGQVKYMARGDGYTLFLTPGDAVFSLRSRSARAAKANHEISSHHRFAPRNPQDEKNAVVRMQLVAANASPRISASDPMPGKSNYFVGNDPSQWRTNIPHFGRVNYQDVYPGVNLAFHGAQRQTEFDFVVAAGASAAPIGFHFTGTSALRTDDSGNLVVASAAGDVLFHKPIAYQEQNGTRHAVDARFALKANNQVAFELGEYDHSRQLVIDPTVTYSTYLGGNGDDEGQGIAADASGNAYVTGQTTSSNFPGASNSLLGTSNAFVTKIAAGGTSLVYSTYLGGTGSLGDSGNAIAVDGSGNAYVAGGTSSSNFPTSASAFQKTLEGTSNAFVAKLNSSGSISYSTYLGGTGTDTALGIALATDGSGDVYVVGKASSSDFPTSPNPLQAYVSGSTDSGFLTKLNATATAPLIFSSYIGGSSDGDLASGVAVDSSNNAYVTGQTFSTTFVTTSGVVQPACNSCSNGNSNAFVTVVSVNNTARTGSYVYSTYLGGSGKDEGDGIALDSTGAAYVTGGTESSDFPTTAGAYQTAYGGNNDAFVTKLNPTGTAPLLYSTYLGGSGFDTGASIGVDASGNVYITGQTASPFPTANATQSSPGGGNDAFVAEINPAGGSGLQLVFSTYLGGSLDEDDGGNYGALAVSSTGAAIYVTGNTESTDFPTSTTVPYSGGDANGGAAGTTDAFVTTYAQVVSPTYSLSASPTSLGTVSPGSPGTTMITATSTTGFTGSVTLSCTVSPVVNLGPTCAAASVTAGGSAATLTVNTTGPTSLLQRPANGRSSGMLYAMLLPVAGLSLMGMRFNSRTRRNRLFALLMIGMVMAALMLMPACGGSSSGGGGGGGGGNQGTPANTYTITVNGSATGAAQTGVPPSLTLIVN